MHTDEHIVCLGFIAFIVFILYSSESRVVFFLELNFYLSCWNFIRYKITQRDLHTDNLYMQTGKRLEENRHTSLEHPKKWCSLKMTEQSLCTSTVFELQQFFLNAKIVTLTVRRQHYFVVIHSRGRSDQIREM